MDKKGSPAEQPAQTDRVTVSLPPKVRIWAHEMCAEKGYANFSAYIGDLIRRDKERQDIKEGIYPAHIDQYDVAAEKPELPSPPKASTRFPRSKRN